jgi:hypothetical protein
MFLSLLTSTILAHAVLAAPTPRIETFVLEGLRTGWTTDLEVQLATASEDLAALPSVGHESEALLERFRVRLAQEDESSTPADRVHVLQETLRDQRSLWAITPRRRSLVGLRSATRAWWRRVQLEEPALSEAITRIQRRQRPAFETLARQYEGLRSRGLALAPTASASERGRLLREARDLASRVEQALRAATRGLWNELTLPERQAACRQVLLLLQRYRWVVHRLDRGS